MHHIYRKQNLSRILRRLQSKPKTRLTSLIARHPSRLPLTETTSDEMQRYRRTAAATRPVCLCGIAHLYQLPAGLLHST